MTKNDRSPHADRIAALARLLASDPRLDAELHRARREFFGESGRAAGGRASAAEHRFAEWFLLERESDTLGAVPITVPPFVESAELLDGSMVGVFVVEASNPSSAIVHDLQDDERVELVVPEGAVLVGDLLVGRLYPGAQDAMVPSVALAVLRPGEPIAHAFVRDLARVELDRRLWQVELEHLLLHPNAALDVATGPAAPPELPLEHLEAQLEQLLTPLSTRHTATSISQHLALAARPGPVLGPLLDEFAFDTDVDLDRARELLLRIWNAHHAAPESALEAPANDAPQPGGPPGETLGERLVRTLDEGLSQHRDLDDLFAQLERMAGVDDQEEGGADGDDDDAADGGSDGNWTADAGDLAPLVQEYLWETGREQDRDAAGLQLWIELQRNAPVQQTDFESVESLDLMRLLLHVYLRAAPTERATQVRTAFAELGRFYDWVADCQEVDRRQVLRDCRGALLDHLDRLQAAGQVLSNANTAERTPGLLFVEDIEERGIGVRDDFDGHHWLEVPSQATHNLRVGDLLLGALGQDEGRRTLAGLVVVLPTDARSLIG